MILKEGPDTIAGFFAEPVMGAGGVIPPSKGYFEIVQKILKKYNIDIKFNNKISYALLPRPHFTTKKLSILRNDKPIGEVGKFRAFISIDKLFFFNKQNGFQQIGQKPLNEF